MCVAYITKTWKVSMGDQGLVNVASCRREEAVFVARGFGPDGPQPPARGESLKLFVFSVGGVSCNFLLASESWRLAVPEEKEVCSQSLSAERMIHFSLPLSLAAAYQMVMEEVRMDSLMAE
ncbi:hypothetical protein AMECASPLE_032469 [Ameca splendens]|uniref:Uncharacterized protein n=1 Tax=Ameca splendens TaxID=208324 RepID=A0ABV0YI09_9TELE